jgi:pectate lyase
VMDCLDNYHAKNRISTEVARNIEAAGYHFDVLSNGSISTEGGALLIEDSHIVGVRYPIRNNQNQGAAGYTGKIRASDMYYKFGDSEFHGGSDSPGSPLAPMPAQPIPFSWNGFTELPYTYRSWPVGSIVARLTSPTEGAGSGIQHWAAQYWMQTTY